MRKKIKKISKPVTEPLRFIVEEFLEKSGKEIGGNIGGPDDAAKTMWEQLERSLFANTFWMDEVDREDMVEIDYEKLLKKYHAFLKPIWDQFRDNLFDYKYIIIPARENSQKLLKTIDRDRESPIFEYKELFKQQNLIYSEKVFDIAMKKSFKPGTLRVSFDPGTVTFYRSNLNVVKNLIDLLSGIDIEHFGRCEWCDKCIVLKRNDKRYCAGCAAKKYQRNKWKEDPEAMKEKERIRYREKRKKS